MILVPTASVAQTYPTYTDLHDFGGTVVNDNGKSGPDGYFPLGITFDTVGNMYGTTRYGGPSSDNAVGMVWEITKAGVYKDLHDFGGTVVNANGKSGPDGEYPFAGVAVDSAGNLYGTTVAGGPNKASTGGDGIVWEITKAGVYKDLHDFGGTVVNANGKSGPDGSRPPAGVTLDSLGDVFGTTTSGGPNVAQLSQGAGMIWEITNGGVYKDLYDFGGTIVNANGTSGPDGIAPESEVSFDSAGNLYGTTTIGGPNSIPSAGITDGGGMVWEITTAGIYKDLHDFAGTVVNADGKSGTDGAFPLRVSFDASGNRYGVTAAGGPLIGGYLSQGAGNIWEITSAGAYKDLHDFGGTVTRADGQSGADGASPFAGVTIDSAGNLYGTAETEDSTGVFGFGMVWEMTKAGVYKDLHDFGYQLIVNTDGNTGPDGISPFAGVTFDTKGNMYGTTSQGGGNFAAANGQGGGILWELSPPVVAVLAHVSLSPATVIGGSSTTGTVTLSANAPAGGTVVHLSSNLVGVSAPASVTVSAGSKTATFTVKTAPVATNSEAAITATLGTAKQQATLTVDAPVLETFTLNSASVVGRSDVVITGTLTISGPPVSAGATIDLKSSEPSAANLPSTAFVHSGNTSVKFTVSHFAVTENSTVTLTASYGGVTKTVTLTVTP